jgi:hypothetical protein
LRPRESSPRAARAVYLLVAIAIPAALLAGASPLVIARAARIFAAALPIAALAQAPPLVEAARTPALVARAVILPAVRCESLAAALRPALPPPSPGRQRKGSKARFYRDSAHLPQEREIIVGRNLHGIEKSPPSIANAIGAVKQVERMALIQAGKLG